MPGTRKSAPASSTEPSAVSRPSGPSASTEAILNAAADLLAERGPGSVTLRAVAERAKVNLGLIHRYLGNKQDVIDATLARTSERVAGRTGTGERGMNTIRDAFIAAADSSYWRMLAHCLLQSDQRADDLLKEEDAVSAIAGAFETAQNEKRIDEDFDPRLMAGIIIALGLGWLMFEPHIRRATGLQESGTVELRYEMWEMLAKILRRLGPNAPEHDW